MVFGQWRALYYFLKSLHKLIVCFVTGSMHANNVERMHMYLYDSFIGVCFILYMKLLFDDVVTGYLFVTDESSMCTDLLRFYSIVYNLRSSEFIFTALVWTSCSHFGISEHITCSIFYSFVCAFIYCCVPLTRLIISFLIFSVDVIHCESFGYVFFLAFSIYFFMLFVGSIDLMG